MRLRSNVSRMLFLRGGMTYHAVHEPVVPNSENDHLMPRSLLCAVLGLKLCG